MLATLEFSSSTRETKFETSDMSDRISVNSFLAWVTACASSSSRPLPRVSSCSKTLHMLKIPCSEMANRWNRSLDRNCIATVVRARKSSSVVTLNDMAKSNSRTGADDGTLSSGRSARCISGYSGKLVDNVHHHGSTVQAIWVQSRVPEHQQQLRSPTGILAILARVLFRPLVSEQVLIKKSKKVSQG